MEFYDPDDDTMDESDNNDDSCNDSSCDSYYSDDDEPSGWDGTCSADCDMNDGCSADS